MKRATEKQYDRMSDGSWRRIESVVAWAWCKGDPNPVEGLCRWTPESRRTARKLLRALPSKGYGWVPAVASPGFLEEVLKAWLRRRDLPHAGHVEAECRVLSRMIINVRGLIPDKPKRAGKEQHMASGAVAALVTVHVPIARGIKTRLGEWGESIGARA